MTNDAQSALRRVIEKYSKNSRFCLICNNINKIIPGLQSRCTKMRFGYLDAVQISQRLQTIIQLEHINIKPEALQQLINACKTFAKSSIHYNVYIFYTKRTTPIDVDDVNHYLGVPTDADVERFMKLMWNNDLSFTEICHQCGDYFKDNRWILVYDP